MPSAISPATTANAANPVRYKTTIADLGQRFDLVVAAQIDGLSRSRAQQWIAEGFVTLDGRVVDAKTKLKPQQWISITPQPDASMVQAAPEVMDLPFVYEDETLLILNKPAGLLVHPGNGQHSGTLMNGLLAHHAGAIDLPRAGIVHRLDQHTSGLMVVAKTLLAYHDLVAQLKARTVSRQYLALVQGATQWHTQHIDAEIGRDPRNRTKMAIVKPGKGKPAQTDALTLARSLDPAVSLVKCVLQSGRTHQIRVHLASLRHSLVGDTQYGGRIAHGFNQQALHAFALALRHPITRETCYFTEPPPELWGAMMQQLGWQAVMDTALDDAFAELLHAQESHANNGDKHNDYGQFADDGDDSDDDDFDDHDVEVIYVKD